MKKLSFFLTILMLITLSSCQVIGGIFKTGVGVGVFIVVFIIAIIMLVMGRKKS